MELNERLIVHENEQLNKILLVYMYFNIDWENHVHIKEEQIRLAQIICARLSGEGLVVPIKNDDGTTTYSFTEPLFVEQQEEEQEKFNIDEFYKLFSNQNLGEPLDRMVNKKQVTDEMTIFLKNNDFKYSDIVKQTKLWIQNKVDKGQVIYVPKAFNFIHRRDDKGKIVESTLKDLMNDPIKIKKIGLI